MEILKKLSKTLDRLVRPTTFPLAVSMMEEGEIPEKAKRPLTHFHVRMSLCQGFSISRRFGFTMGFDAEDHECPIALVAFGLKKESKLLDEGAMAYPLYAATPEIGAKINRTLRMNYSPKRKFIMSPLSDADTIPDVVLVHGNSAQINRLIIAVAFMTGEPLQGEFIGRGTCVNLVYKSMRDRNYQVAIPGAGERALALVGDDELIFAVPKEKFEELAEGLEKSQKAGGCRYPTLFPALLQAPPYHPGHEAVFKELGLK